MSVIAFWSACSLLLYVYALYPLLARFLARYLAKPVHPGAELLSVTVIVTVYNEERGIRAKLDNLMALDYPAHLTEIIVASDASTDATEELVRSCGCNRVRLLRIDGRQGKTACQNAAAVAARGDILVFTDATTRLDPQSIRRLVAPFGTPEIGCVAGRLVYLSRGASATGKGGEAYWDQEIRLRMAESALGSLVGVSGCLYAARRSSYRPIEPQLISDFVISWYMREQSLRTVLAVDAICFEDTLDRGAQELSMRVRVALRSINALIRERRFLNPGRYGLFAWQLWSHKVLRYASPFLWLVALAANAVAATDSLPYLILFAGQVALLAAGIAGFVLQSRGRASSLLWPAYYFLLTNLASLVATLRYIRGERITTWKPLR